jgi:hypothetical protein
MQTALVQRLGTTSIVGSSHVMDDTQLKPDLVSIALICAFVFVGGVLVAGVFNLVLALSRSADARRPWRNQITGDASEPTT